eukprot:6852252-Prymnesium_polylepis.1
MQMACLYMRAVGRRARLSLARMPHARAREDGVVTVERSVARVRRLCLCECACANSTYVARRGAARAHAGAGAVSLSVSPPGGRALRAHGTQPP